MTSSFHTPSSLHVLVVRYETVDFRTFDKQSAIFLCEFLSCEVWGRLRLKCDGARAETRFRLSAKRTSPFKSAGASVQPTTGSRGVRISGSNAGYTIFRGSVKSTGYPLHSPVSPSLPLPCVIVCHHISTGLYNGYANVSGGAFYLIFRASESFFHTDDGDGCYMANVDSLLPQWRPNSLKDSIFV
jgi:hypothetical protein